MAAQLCQAPQLVAYRQLLLSDPHLQGLLSLKECIANPHGAFVNGVLEPLAGLKRSGEDVIQFNSFLFNSTNAVPML